jgi:SHS2 domain-containing protein
MATDRSAAPYEILEHTADIGLLARGRTLEQTFENAAWGTAEILDRGAAAIVPVSLNQHEEGRDFPGVSASTDTEALLVDFLNEVVLWLLQDDPAPPRCLEGIRVARVGPRVISLEPELGAEMEYSLRLTECAGPPDGTELKAATYHQLAIRQTDDGYEATVYFDV